MYNKSFLQLPGKLPDADPEKCRQAERVPIPLSLGISPPFPPACLPPRLIFQNGICAPCLLLTQLGLWSTWLTPGLGGQARGQVFISLEQAEEGSGVALQVSHHSLHHQGWSGSVGLCRALSKAEQPLLFPGCMHTDPLLWTRRQTEMSANIKCLVPKAGQEILLVKWWLCSEVSCYGFTQVWKTL